jgi:hypothetical protein
MFRSAPDTNLRVLSSGLKCGKPILMSRLPVAHGKCIKELLEVLLTGP